MLPALALLVLGSQALPSLAPGLKSRTVVLTYHDMVPVRDSKALWFDCTPRELEQQLDWLMIRGASFISIDQLFRHLSKGEKLPPKSVAITFADNYQGFYKHALPILRKRKIPVTMFVHTDFIGGTTGRPKMTWAQLKELDQEGLVTIASQTRTHPADLRKQSIRELDAEFRGSKLALENQLRHPIPYVAYPNGKYDRRVALRAQKAGYEMAFTEEQMPAERSPNLLMVARYVHTKYAQAWSQAR